MYECAGTRPGSILRLQLFALLTIAGAISLNTAIYIGLLTNTPKPDNPATIAEPAAYTRQVRVSRGRACGRARHEAGDRHDYCASSTG